MALALMVAGVAGAAPAGGYGRFAWGASTAAVRAAEPGARVHAGAEPVAAEKAALDRIAAAERAAAAAAGRAALLAWKKQARPAARLMALRYWVTLAGLSGRVELRFVDDGLYEAVVRVLYRAGEKPAAGAILDALVEKYGAPLDPPVGQAPVEARPRLDFALPGGGALRVMRRPVEGPRGRGMLRLHYRGPGSAAVAEYLDGLGARAAALEAAARPEAQPAPAAKPDAEAAAREALLRHL
ncbi:MAG: hypothetical protein H6705_03535 [Myxococcales bacterium]|nr:hypothetical protein [Myxococcales bacterium]